ncbi:MAG: hypothetical protein ACPLRH_06745, partial [Desulfotomaculales bacterium]
MKFPFEVPFHEIQSNPEPYISLLFSSLESEFLVLPKGPGFVEYPVFEKAYQVLRLATKNFTVLETETIFSAATKAPLALIVLRCILGFTPPEWAYLTTRRTGIEVSQNFARTLDRKIRMNPFSPLKLTPLGKKRVLALIETAVQLLSTPFESTDGEIHRLDKADTKEGILSVQHLCNLGVPYAMLLYERLLGRPFAGHRDSVSELVGDSLESVIEDVLSKAGISYRKTKRAEKIPGFDQAPDFVIPDEYAPRVVIEAKITEDDGTARDKVTRIQHLAALSVLNRHHDEPRFEVVACIGGRGFGVRREDMKKLLLATRGKVFTLKTMEKLIDHTRLREFRT